MGKNLALLVIAITQWELLLFEIEVRNEEMAVVVLGGMEEDHPGGSDDEPTRGLGTILKARHPGFQLLK
jgi:hypothetical protein